MVGAIPPWLPRLWVPKRVGTGARTLPEVEGSKVKSTPQKAIANSRQTYTLVYSALLIFGIDRVCGSLS